MKNKMSYGLINKNPENAIIIPSKNKTALINWGFKTDIIYPTPIRIRIIELAKTSLVKEVPVTNGEIPQKIKTKAKIIPNLFICLIDIIIFYTNTLN